MSRESYRTYRIHKTHRIYREAQDYPYESHRSYGSYKSYPSYASYPLRLALGAFLFLGLSSFAFAQQPAPSPAPTPAPLVVSVRDLGPQFTTNTAHVLGHDDAYSIPLPDGSGRSLWVFGDTYTGTRSDEGKTSTITGMPTNTMVILRDTDARDGLAPFTYGVDAFGTATAMLRFLPHEEMEKLPGEDTVAMRLWPMHGIALPSAGGSSKVILFYSMEKLIAGPPPPANFRHAGTGIAVATIGPRDTAPPVFERITRNGDPALWGPDDPVVGTSVLRAKEGGYLVYASGRRDNRGAAFLARVPEGSLTDPGSYRWLARFRENSRHEYTNDIRKAAPLFYDMPGEMSVTWNPYLSRYVAIHTIILGPDTAIRTAPAPEGPWSEPEVFYRPAGVSPQSFFYAAKEHLWLARDFGQTLYITYIDSAEYWPHLLELKLR